MAAGCGAFAIPATADEVLVAGMLEQLPQSYERPVMWFRGDAQRNFGTAGEKIAAVVGGQLNLRGDDPWRSVTGAFGVKRNEPTGAAVSGSTATRILASEAGGIVFFIRPPMTPGEDGLIFARGSWGEDRTFELKLYKDGMMAILTSTSPGIRPARLDLGKLTPGAWQMVALSWRRDGDAYGLQWWMGRLEPGAVLMRAEGRISTPGSPTRPVTLGGRSALRGTSVPMIPLPDVLFCHLAVYEVPLLPEDVGAIYAAACDGVK